MKKFINKLAVLLFIVIMQSVACSEEHTIAVKPVELTVERTAPPFEGAVWIENEYRWDGNTYIVVPAHWVKSEGNWVRGSWKNTENGYTWSPGYWKK